MKAFYDERNKDEGREEGVNKAVRVPRELIFGLSLQSSCDRKFNLFDNFITNSTSLI